MLRTVVPALETAAQYAYRRAVVASAQHPAWYADALSASAQPNAFGLERSTHNCIQRRVWNPSPCGSLVGHNVCLAPTGWKAFSTSEFRAKDVKADDPGKTTKEEADVNEEGEKEEGGKDEGEKEQHHKPVDARTRLLDASLKHVSHLGWSADAMRAGASDEGLSPASLGLLKRGEVELVEYFEAQCMANLVRELAEQRDLLADMRVSEKIATATRSRLEMTIPYLSHLPTALSLQAQPSNVLEGLRLRAMLMDEIWFGIGDTSTDTTWYTKRAALLGVYTATELYMITDASPGFKDTWAFMGRRVEEMMACESQVHSALESVAAAASPFGKALVDAVQNASAHRYKNDKK